MIAKEKAKELVEKFYSLPANIDKYGAKQCALIAVNEILNIDNESYYNYNREYYQQVKQEIEQL